MSKADLVDELHREARRNFTRRRTNMRGIEDTIQADLVEMIPYADVNRNMKYILVAINIFSKKAFERPLPNKTGKEVAKSLKSILDSMNHPIRNLHVDEGKEFYNASVKQLVQQYGINMYSTHSRTSMKAAIVERFNRTLKSKMWKQFSYRGTYKWVRMLPSLIDEYNNTKHRTIKMKPNDVNARNEQRLLKSVYDRKWNISSKTKAKFKVGDSVRLSKYKYLFEKGYTPNWTTEIFEIRQVVYGNPITYRLVDLEGQEIQGTIYQEELQIVQNPKLYLIEKIIRKKGEKVYVKWLGFDASHNSWINESNVL